MYLAAIIASSGSPYEAREFQTIHYSDYCRFPRRKFVRKFRDRKLFAVGKCLYQGYLGEGEVHGAQFGGYICIEPRGYFPYQQRDLKAEFGSFDFGLFRINGLHTNNMYEN